MSTQRVFLQPHDSRWADDFAREAAAVVRGLGSAVRTIHHIGSTAIPGIHAKPIIDMLAVADDLSLLDEYASRLAVLGYEALGEFGISGRRYFRKNNSVGERTHHIHAFRTGSAHITRHLAFRDYLRAHPDSARDYDALKHRLAEACSYDSGGYTDGKDAFIRAIDLRAAAWLSEPRDANCSAHEQNA